MANMHGKNSVIVLYDSGGASQNLSGDTNNVSLQWSRDNPDITTFGKDTVHRLAGLRDYTLSVTGISNNAGSATSDTLDDIMTGSGYTTFKYYPYGNVTAGCEFWTGSAILSSYEETSPLNGPVGFSYVLQAGSGSLTASVV